MNDLMTDLRALQAHPVNSPTKAIVFVHGIFSSHKTFEPLVSGLTKVKPALAAWEKYYFDYDFYEKIADSGKQLIDTLRQSFPNETAQVTIVGHSMGGLVARAALLQGGDLGIVKRLVMLGTPNHGTLATARLGALAQLMRETTGVLWNLFPRKAPGIKELTEIGKTMDPLLGDGGRERTRNVEYVTVPGLRFHAEAGWLDAPDKTSPGLRALGVFLAIMKVLPGMHTDLEIPHDGIVEESSVKLSGKSDYFSERQSQGVGQPPFAPYLHLLHQDYKSVDHVTVQQASRTIQLLAELLDSPDLATWHKTLATTGEYVLWP
jgi:pimeloyl-ACP methyl ester carboxylesterase